MDKLNKNPFDWDFENNGTDTIPVEIVESNADSTEKVNSMISSAISTIKLVKNDNLTYTLMVNGKESGKIDIPEDQFLKNVSYNADNHNLSFTFNTSNGEIVTDVDMSDLSKAYSAGEGITINADGTISCALDLTDYVKFESFNETKDEYDIKITRLEQIINYLLQESNTKAVSDVDGLKQILTTGNNALLTNSVTLTSSFDMVSSATPVKIDLNGNTIKTTSVIRAARGGDITFANGTIESGNNSYLFGTSTGGGTITLDNIDVVSKNSAAVIALLSGDSTINIKNSRIVSNTRIINANKNLTNLNINVEGCELTSNGEGSPINLTNTGVEANVSVKNSTIRTADDASSVTVGINMNAGSLSITDTNIISNGMGIVTLEKCDTVIKNTNITANLSYALSTNATTAYDSTFIIENCNLTSNIGTAILYNIPGELTIKDSTIKGAVQSVFARGGNINIENSSVILDATDDSVVGAYVNENWDTGNKAPVSAITLGNRNENAYQYPTSLSLVNCSVENVGDLANSLPTIYVHANSGENLGVTFNYDDATVFNGGQGLFYESNNITVNGNEIVNPIRYDNDGKTVIS